MNVAIFALALLASPAPTATASPVAVTIQGIVLGETAMAMVAARGEPLRVSDSQDGKDYLYPASADNGLVFAHVVNGNVVGVGVEPPPWTLRAGDDLSPMPSALGVALGDTMAAVAKLPKKEFVSASQGSDGSVSAIYRGADGLNYTFLADKSGKIVWILAQLSGAVAGALAASPDPSLHGGASMADAIVDIAPTDDIGVRYEYFYLSAHTCGNNGSWKTTGQALLQHAGRSYDKLSVTCSDGGAKRDFYFDITGYFGKT